MPVHVALHNMQKKTSSKLGFTLVEIMIVVAIIGLLAAIAIPNFVKARNSAQTNACINNLVKINGAKEQWALENKKGTNDPVRLSDLTAYFKDNHVPASVAGETYSVTTVGALVRAVSKKPIQEHQGPFTVTSF